jgi:hypothetical protein
MNNRKGGIVKDDASRFLENLSPEERRPKEPGIVPKGSLRSHRSFTKEEREVAMKALCPPAKK